MSICFLCFPTKKNNCLCMPWDNSVNKNAIIYAAHTTLSVRNMSLTAELRVSSTNPFKLHVINHCIQNNVAV